MKRFFKQLLLFAWRDVHLLIACGIAIWFICAHLLDKLHLFPWEEEHKGNVSLQGVFIIFMGLVLSLVINELRRSYQRLSEGNPMKECNEKLARIAETSCRRRVDLRDFPMRDEDYAYLWGGYTGDYDVYNPAYHCEEGAGWDRVVELLVERYRSVRFTRARYLFLTSDENGRINFEKFRNLMAEVKAKCPDVARKLTVKTISKNADAGAEMYLGTRDGVRTAVLEPRDPALGMTHGNAHYYLVITGWKEVIDDHLQKYFNAEWELAKEEKNIFVDKRRDVASGSTKCVS